MYVLFVINMCVVIACCLVHVLWLCCCVCYITCVCVSFLIVVCIGLFVVCLCISWTAPRIDLYVSLNCVMYLFLILEQRNVFIRGLIVLFMERPPDLEVDCGLGQEIVADHVLPGVYTCVCICIYIYIYIYTHMYVCWYVYVYRLLSIIFGGIRWTPALTKSDLKNMRNYTNQHCLFVLTGAIFPYIISPMYFLSIRWSLGLVWYLPGEFE